MRMRVFDTALVYKGRVLGNAGLKVAHRLVAGAGSFSMTGTAAALTLQTSLTLLGVFSASMIPALWWILPPLFKS